MFLRRDEFVEQTDWFGKAMSVEEYHELEQLSPDRKYEYIHGKVYMMSRGSIEHDRIRRNVESTLDRYLRSSPCEVSGVDVQVLVGTKKNGKPHMSILIQRFRVTRLTGVAAIRLSKRPVW